MCRINSDSVVQFFAADPAGPMLTLTRHAADRHSPILSDLDEYLAAIPATEVQSTCEDVDFRFFADRTSDLDRAARVWIAERQVAREIARRKLSVLRSADCSPRSAPYELRALHDVPVDVDGLVPLSAFTFDGARLLRNEHAFLVLTTTGAPNSTHWLLASLYSENLESKASVRLDPFLHGPVETFPAMFYRMWMYGRPLDWDRIAGLSAPDFGQWRPSGRGHRSEFTDFVWSPRGGEVHFACEEVPTVADAETEPSRYFHAVYLPDSRCFEHFDGALRVYTVPELRARYLSHVRHAGKVGIRRKVFRVQGDVPRESLSVIAQSFFVWNKDVTQYFGPEPHKGGAA